MRFEHRIAKEFGIPLLRVASPAQLRRALPRIPQGASIEHGLDLLWGSTVSSAVTRATSELTLDDIQSSSVNTTARTGLDLFDRAFHRVIDEMFRAKFAPSKGEMVAIVAIGVTLLALVGGGLTWLVLRIW